MTDRTIVIGLHGAARSGKDTAGAALVEKLGFERVSFAQRLYGVLLATDPYVPRFRGGVCKWPRVGELVAEIGWEQAKDEVPEVRRLLQTLATEGIREHLGYSTWVDAAVADVKPGGSYVFTDVRFDNEAEAVRALGGEVWRITRPGREVDASHASEAGLPDALISRTIENDGSVADLRRKVLSVFTPA